MDNSTRKAICAAVTLGLYVVSLFCPVLSFRRGSPGEDIYFGMEALLVGVLPPGTISRSANIALFWGLVSYLRDRLTVAVSCGVAGVLLAASAPVVFEIENGRLEMGYWLWLASMMTLAAFSIIGYAGQKARIRTESEPK